MGTENTDVLIIGAGLTGMTLGYLLTKAGLSFKIVEARDRIGGRIHTLNSVGKTPLEMGATWLGAKHTSLVKLLRELGLETFKQELGQTAIYEPMSISPHQIVELPANNDPSFRIKGGTSSLIDALNSKIDKSDIYLNEVAKSIVFQDEKLILTTSSKRITSKKIVSTLPPYLFHKNIKTEPKLPDIFEHVISSTHTWMGESIKVALTFAKPFWREHNLSGTIFSNVGPIPEMYDHSNFEDSLYALKGFLNGNYFSYDKSQRLELVLTQLEKYFGKVIRSYTSYEEVVWRKEEFTSTPYDNHILPHQNNGHPLYQESYLDNRLYIAGAETAQAHPGYMDGAVSSASYIASKITATI